MAKLFPTATEPSVARPPGRVVALAIAQNVWRTYDYRWPEELGEPSLGQRVHVPFGGGNRKSLAFVTDLSPAQPPQASRQLKTVDECLDAESPFDETLWRLGAWMSEYYLTPLGMVLAAMVPSSVGRHAPRLQTMVVLASEPSDWPAALGKRQRSALDELLEARRQGVESISMEQLVHHSGASRATLDALARRNLIRTETRPVELQSPQGPASDAAAPFDLNDDQQAVLSELRTKLGGGYSATLLHGVTGSGKTEVYVQAIRQVVAAGRQVILLAPEIALATQTFQRLILRLPRVAVLHSGLTGAQRALCWEQIRDGRAAVVVGPRSAVFAPARSLGLIVVDEEHEPSYKQDTAPRYHGRDVAVMRAMLAGVPVLLGSATPSLESLSNAIAGRYVMLRLPRRVCSLPMPHLEVVNLRKEMQPGRIELIGRTLTNRLAGALDAGGQAILLMNRRGYASYVFCPSCQWSFECDRCSRAMVFHQATRLALCHYCQHAAELPEHCPACGKKLVLFGYGIQRIENELSRKFPQAVVARMDSDTMTTPGQFQNVLSDFAAGKVDILLGTQMVAKGLDFPNVRLVGVVSADTSLAIPDFRSAERTFQLIVQVAGRAGRHEHAGEVIVQTLHEEEPAIQFAIRHDYDAFARVEMELRRQIAYPPFARIVRFVARHAVQDKAVAGIHELVHRLKPLLPPGTRMIGPQKAGVEKVADQYRFQVMLFTDRPGVLQQRLAGRMEELTRTTGAEILADVDPMNLM